MGGVLANAACLHSKLLQNPTIKVVYNIFSDLHTDNDLSCLSGVIIYASGDLSQKGIEQNHQR